MIRSLWYLNINSTNGVAIGKCGNKGSNLTDLDITAGLITASQQLNNEMVNNEETSKYHIEEIKGGSKRITLYSTWANEISKHDKTLEIPIVTSMLQISSPEMQETDYSKLLLFLRDLNDQIIYRFILRELVQERTIDPIIHIDILNHLVKKYNVDQKGILGSTSKNLEQLIEHVLTNIFEKNKNILKILLSRVPLQSTFFQQEYIKSIQGLKKFLKNQITEFLIIETFLTYIREEKIYAEKNSFKNIRNHYNEYLDKQETYFQNKTALNNALERSILILENLTPQFDKLAYKDNVKDFYEIKKALLEIPNIEQFLKEIYLDFKKNTSAQKFNIIKEKSNYKELDVNKDLVKENIVSKEDSKESYKKLKILKENLQAIVFLTEKLFKADTTSLLDKLKNKFEKVINQNPKFENKSNQVESYYKIKNTLVRYNEYNQSLRKILTGNNYREKVSQMMKKSRSNLLTKLLDALFSEIFHSYSHFKYVIAYPGDFKKFIIEKLIQHLNQFLKNIQNFGFANILNEILRIINPNNLIKYYSTCLLRSFLANFLLENFRDHPFAITDINPVLAFDTYSLKFCAEIIKNSGLNEDIYNVIDQIKLPEDYKESFVQIMDSTGLTTEDIINELNNSRKIFNSWVNHIDDLMNSLKKVKKNITPNMLIDYCYEFIEENKNKADEYIEKGIYFIKDNILKNTKKGSIEQRNELIEIYNNEIEIQELKNKLQKIENDTTKIFGGKHPYNKLISKVNSLLANQLNQDKEIISDIINSLDYLVDTQKVENVKFVLNKIDNFRKLFENSNEVKKLEENLSNVFEYERFKELYIKLDALNNKFLKLEQYSHIKGLLKTASSQEPIFGKSKIECKYKAYNLLLEALVETYSVIYEDFFGKFSFEDTKGLFFSDVKVTINLGKIFNYQYNIVKKAFQFKTGLDRLKDVFENIEKYSNKFDYIDLNYAMNYLRKFKKHNEYIGSELIEYLYKKENLKKFFDYIINYFSKKSKIKDLQESIKILYTNTLKYIKGSGKVPFFPKDLRVLKDEQLLILHGILENVQKSDKSFYIKGNHPDKNHPSNKYNLNNLSEKKIEKLIENINEIESFFRKDISFLFKKLSYEAENLRPLEEIIDEVHDELKESIKQEVEKYSLSEYDFKDINKIRIMALLNRTEYELPLDIKLYLINQGRYNRATIENLIKASTKISELFKLIINRAVLKDPVLKALLNIQLKFEENGTAILPYKLTITSEITTQNKFAIFGKNSLWENQHYLKGFKLSEEESHKKTYEQVLKTKVNLKISEELKPLMNILNKYSREIHTGFNKVYKKLFE